MSSSTEQKIRLQILHGTSAYWTSGAGSTLTIKPGELALNIETGELRYGNNTSWNNSQSINAAMGSLETEEWDFTLEDDTTLTKEVYIKS